MKLKRAFLMGLIVCLSAASLLGVVMLLAGRSSEFTLRSLMTLVTVGLFSGVALAAADVHEKNLRWRPLMLVAYVLQAVGAIVYLAAIWGLFEALTQHHDAGEMLAKCMGLLATWSIAVPLAGQLAGLRLTDTPALLRPAAIVLSLALAAMITLAIVFEIDSGAYYRLLAVVGILAAAAGVIGRIAQRVQGLDRIAGVESVRLAMQIVCPRCLLTQTVANGPSRCSRCRLKFTLDIEEPRCPQCNYLLFKLTSPLCPECGHKLAPEETAAAASGDGVHVEPETLA